MKANLLLLPQLLPAIRKVSGSSYLSKTIWPSAHKTPSFATLVFHKAV